MHAALRHRLKFFVLGTLCQQTKVELSRLEGRSWGLGKEIRSVPLHEELRGASSWP